MQFRRTLLALGAGFWLTGCGGGGGSSSIGISPVPPVPPPPPPPTYTPINAVTPSTELGGPAQGSTTNTTANALAAVSGGTLAGQGTITTAGVQSFTINVTNVGGVTFSETFQAADLSTSTPIPGQAPRTLLTGTKTASDGSVRTLTLLDTATSGFNYMLLGAWGYASTAVATSITGQSFVVGSVTLGSDIPTTGTATYNGVMFGRYADGAALWNATATAGATADFANRNVAFTTTNTQIANQSVTQAAPNLNLSGTLTYPAATNNVTGTVSTVNGLTGNANAQFYGPAAVELGGTFFVKDPGNTKQMTGNFGLKK
jgi:hypothetical protein